MSFAFLVIYCYDCSLGLGSVFAIDTNITPNPLLSLASLLQNWCYTGVQSFSHLTKHIDMTRVVL